MRFAGCAETVPTERVRVPLAARCCGGQAAATAEDWLACLLSFDPHAAKVIRALDRCSADYEVVVEREVSYRCEVAEIAEQGKTAGLRGFGRGGVAIYSVLAWLLLDERAAVVHRLAT